VSYLKEVPSGTHIRFTELYDRRPVCPVRVEHDRDIGWRRTALHKAFSESCYVMEGLVRLFNGETSIDAAKGDFLYVPRGGIHAFSNESSARWSEAALRAPSSSEGQIAGLEVAADRRESTSRRFVGL
jgi:mannose-6-phosphate isomerase-like protein (cupin superfamily)